MAVSKRTRFEVLRRDDYTCRYCRSKDNPLTIDHVVPVSLGGTDEPSNLVASCMDCNSGKASTAPDQGLVDDVDEDAARWQLARARAAQKLADDAAAARVRRQPFLDRWREWDKTASSLPDDWGRSIDWWMSDGVTMDRILEAHDIAAWGKSHQVRSDDVFRYMAGIIRNWVREIDTLARAELESEGE